MPEAELLDEDDAPPGLGQRPCRRDAGDPRPDYDDVGIAAHRADPRGLRAARCSARQPPSVAAAFVAARASAL